MDTSKTLRENIEAVLDTKLTDTELIDAIGAILYMYGDDSQTHSSSDGVG